MKARLLLSCATLGCALAAWAADPTTTMRPESLIGQVKAVPATPTLRVSYAGKTVVISALGIAALPHWTVTAYDAHDQKTHTFSGVPVRDLLARVDAPSGEKLRGKALSLAVVTHSLDGYELTFALAEFDGAFNPRTILLVDREDGQILRQGTGPFRLVVPGDKRPARWARMVTSLDVVPIN